MALVSSALVGFSTFGREGRSAFFLAVMPLDFLGGGVSPLVAGLFLVAAFSANAFTLGHFSESKENTS